MAPGKMKMDLTNKNRFRWVVLVIATAIVVFVITSLAIPGRSHALNQNSPLENDQIEALQRMLQTPMSPEMHEILTEKLNALQSMSQEQVSALESAPEKPYDACSEMPVPEATSESLPPTGILEDIQPPFPPMKYTITSTWQDFVDGNLTRVYSGALGEDPLQGVLIVTQRNREGGGVFLTSEKLGSLTITSADGTRLLIQAESGVLLFFDTAAMQFISTLEEIPPTVTPAATFTPIPPMCP